jgi:hypothetical protein
MMTLCELCSEKVYETVDKKAVTNSSQEKSWKLSQFEKT